MSKKFKKLSEEIIHENPWWRYMHDTYEREDGRVGDYFYGESGGMSMVVPVMPDGRLVMILQFRYLDSKRSIEFPGGGIKSGSHPLKAAEEELREETGYVAKDFIKVGEAQPSNGLLKDKTHVFLANIESQQEMNPDDTEDIEVIYRYPDEVDKMIQNNDIWCGQTIIAWALTRHFFMED